MRKKKDIWFWLGIINKVFSMPIASAMTGFGFFFYYMIFNGNVWASMIIGLYISALMSFILTKRQEEE